MRRRLGRQLGMAPGQEEDQIGFLDNARAIFGRAYAAAPIF